MGPKGRSFGAFFFLMGIRDALEGIVGIDWRPVIDDVVCKFLMFSESVFFMCFVNWKDFAYPNL